MTRYFSIQGTQISSKWDHYVHFVWATKHREPLVTPEIERAVYRCIVDVATKLKCPVRAINGMPDHVHLILGLHPDVCTSRMMKQVKGISSAMVNDIYDHQKRFRWQPTYYVKAISLSHVSSIVEYVENQKQHHAEGTLRMAWEDTADEEITDDEGTINDD